MFESQRIILRVCELIVKATPFSSLSCLQKSYISAHAQDIPKCIERFKLQVQQSFRLEDDHIVTRVYWTSQPPWGRLPWVDRRSSLLSLASANAQQKCSDLCMHISESVIHQLWEDMFERPAARSTEVRCRYIIEADCSILPHFAFILKLLHHCVWQGWILPIPILREMNWKDRRQRIRGIWKKKKKDTMCCTSQTQDLA